MIKRLLGILSIIGLSLFMGRPVDKDLMQIHYETFGGSNVPAYVGPVERLFYAPIPYKDNYLFKGWYLDATLQTPLNDFNHSQNKTLYAKWDPIDTEETWFHFSSYSDKTGHHVTLHVNGDVNIQAYDIEILGLNDYMFDDVKSDMPQIINTRLNHRIRFNFIDLEKGIKHAQSLIQFTVKTEIFNIENLDILIHEIYTYQASQIIIPNYKTH